MAPAWHAYGEWLCDACGEPQAVSDTLCRRCRAPRHPERRRGARHMDDWLCPECREMQPATSKVCWDCRTEKPLDAHVVGWEERWRLHDDSDEDTVGRRSAHGAKRRTASNGSASGSHGIDVPRGSGTGITRARDGRGRPAEQDKRRSRSREHSGPARLKSRDQSDEDRRSCGSRVRSSSEGPPGRTAKLDSEPHRPKARLISKWQRLLRDNLEVSSPAGAGRAAPVETVTKERRGQVRLNLWQLPLDMEMKELLDIASEFGTVLSRELWREGAFKCANLEFETREMAAKALVALNDRRIYGSDRCLKALLCD